MLRTGMNTLPTSRLIGEPFVSTWANLPSQIRPHVLTHERTYSVRSSFLYQSCRRRVTEHIRSDAIADKNGVDVPIHKPRAWVILGGQHHSLFTAGFLGPEFWNCVTSCQMPLSRHLTTKFYHPA